MSHEDMLQLVDFERELIDQMSPLGRDALYDSLVKASRPSEINFRGQRIIQAGDRPQQTMNGAIMPRGEYIHGLLASARSPPPLDELKDERR